VVAAVHSAGVRGPGPLIALGSTGGGTLHLHAVLANKHVCKRSVILPRGDDPVPREETRLGGAEFPALRQRDPAGRPLGWLRTPGRAARPLSLRNYPPREKSPPDFA
jgi:hypothetical protein